MADLNGFSVFGGIVFLVVIFLVIYPLSFRLPRWLSHWIRSLLSVLRLTDKYDSNRDRDTAAGIELDGLSKDARARDDSKSPARKPIRLTLGLSSAPLLGVLLLLVTTTIGGQEIAKGIAGTDGVRPYDVLVLFICLAYIATALDATGGLRYLAFKVALRASSGNQLYFYLYAFFFLSGAVIGNDPIVLSGTPFLAYLTRVSGITPPTAWVFSQFLAANVSSAILVSSNPTNVLIAGAFGLNFLSGFTKYTVLPSVVAAIVVYPVFVIAFKNKKVVHLIDKTAEGEMIPSKFIKPDVDPASALVDPHGAVFHGVLLLSTLGVLVGTSFAKGVHVWMVTLAGAGVGLTRDVVHDLKHRNDPSRSSANRKRQTPSTTEGTNTPIEAGIVQNGTPSPLPVTMPPAGQSVPDKTDLAAAGLSGDEERVTLPSLWRKFSRAFPSTSVTLSRLPWPLLPFAIGMFILTRSLDHLGYIPIFASWTAKACTSPARAVFFAGGITAIGLCPFCGTNIGATILAVEILTNANFLQAPHVQADPRIVKGAIYAVALASNTGALVSLPASLAGLLWSRILSQKGIRISQAGFSIINAIPLCIITFSALGIVLIEVLYFK